jgi:hypothetical protein
MTKRRHRELWIEHYGPIPEGYVIHHIDHDHSNNVIENLACMPRGQHNTHHNNDRVETGVHPFSGPDNNAKLWSKPGHREHVSSVNSSHMKRRLAEGYKPKPVCLSGSSNPRARAVRCIQTDIVYDTMAEAAQACGVTYQTVWSHCRGRSTGKAHNASKYTFTYA